MNVTRSGRRSAIPLDDDRPRFHARALLAPTIAVLLALAPFAAVTLASPLQAALAALPIATALALLARTLPRSWPHARFGAANTVTLFRLGLAGLLAAQLLASGEPASQATPFAAGGVDPAWIVFALAALAAALDALDGWLARRSGMDGTIGARFDMESDAFLILVLSALAWHTSAAGPWILASGLLRYAFVAAGMALPWMRAPLPFSQRRRAVCAVQVATLVACLLPALPGSVTATIAALGLAALVWSFAADVRALAPPPARSATRAFVLALGLPLLLNAALSFDNLWPTPAIRPDARVAPEFVLLWLALLAIPAGAERLARRALGVLALLTSALVIGRYLDVTAPALFGRPISLYWDGRELPSAIGQLLTEVPWWQVAALVAGSAVALRVLYLCLHRLLAATLRHSALRARRSVAGRAASAALVALVGANLAGVEATWPWVSRPLLPDWWRQVEVALKANSPAHIAATLTPSPRFDADLTPLRSNDFYLIFSESYGAAAIDDPAFSRPLRPDRDRLERRLAAAGAQAVSIRARSPTFAGGSWLAHAALLAGVDTRDPAHYQLLLTTPRDNLVRLFARRGYRTLGVIPGLRTSWPEGGFYAFDRLFDSPTLDWRGPEFGYWRIPDQYTIARVEADEPRRGQPRFVFFATLSTHIPFRPLAPYQPDWARLLGPEPFDAAPLAASLAQRADWLDLREPWIASLRYSFAWIADLVERTRPAGATLLVLGDHQPAASVVGKGVAWDVPVHLISSDPALLQRFRTLGFRDGLEPPAPATIDLHQLTPILLDALDGRGAMPSTQRPAGPPAGPGAG
ncbi:MAG: CDP-alcohol phosphatidyltransferase family protein [Lautropia sp.]